MPRDDGRGIDYDLLRKVAVERGFMCAGSAVLWSEELLFLDGLSSKDTVTDLSGRGVGLSDVRAGCETYGGRIEVRSRREAGTHFGFVFPPPPGLPALTSPSGARTGRPPSNATRAELSGGWGLLRVVPMRVSRWSYPKAAYTNNLERGFCSSTACRPIA